MRTLFKTYPIRAAGSDTAQRLLAETGPHHYIYPFGGGKCQ